MNYGIRSRQNTKSKTSDRKNRLLSFVVALRKIISWKIQLFDLKEEKIFWIYIYLLESKKCVFRDIDDDTIITSHNI